MASPNTGASGRSVGVALIAIVVGTSLVFSYIASDGKFLPPFFSSGEEKPNSATAETTESAATPPESPTEKEPGSDQRTVSDNQALSSEERQRLLQGKNFPWSSASGEYLRSLANQDAIDGFKQRGPTLQSSQSAELTSGLSILSDPAAGDLDNFMVYNQVNDYEDGDEQLDLTFEEDVSDDDTEPVPATRDTEQPEESPPAEQGADEPDLTVPDEGNDTDDQESEEGSGDEQTDPPNNETSDGSGSNNTGTSENPSNSTGT